MKGFGVFAIFKDDEGHTTIKMGDVDKLSMDKGIMKLRMDEDNVEHEVLESEISVLIPTYGGVGYPVIAKETIPSRNNHALVVNKE